MDTRIWMRNADGSLVPLSDDAGSNKFARLMVYVDCRSSDFTPPHTINTLELLVAAKSVADNAGSFNLVKSAGQIWNACYYDTAPMVSVDTYGGVQLYRTN
jgi:hypothetical protein